MVLFLREAMRVIASLGCEGVMRAIASSMSPHATSQQGPTPILSAATADGKGVSVMRMAVSKRSGEKMYFTLAQLILAA
jgi:hypothetical protein